MKGDLKKIGMIYEQSLITQEYILVIGFSDMGEEYTNLKLVNTSTPKEDLVEFAQELHGDEAELTPKLAKKYLKGKPGDYIASLPGSDAAYLASSRTTFINGLKQNDWSEDQIKQVLDALQQNGSLKYEYYYEEPGGYLKIDDD